VPAAQKVGVVLVDGQFDGCFTGAPLQKVCSKFFCYRIVYENLVELLLQLGRKSVHL